MEEDYDCEGDEDRFYGVCLNCAIEIESGPSYSDTSDLDCFDPENPYNYLYYIPEHDFYIIKHDNTNALSIVLLFPDDVEWNLYSVDRGVFEKFGFNMDGYRCSKITDDDISLCESTYFEQVAGKRSVIEANIAVTPNEKDIEENDDSEVPF